MKLFIRLFYDQFTMILTKPTAEDGRGVFLSFESVHDVFYPDSFMCQRVELLKLVYDLGKVDRSTGAPISATEDLIQELKSQESSLCGRLQPLSNIKWLKGVCQNFASLAIGYEPVRRFHVLMQTQFSTDANFKDSIIDRVLP